MAFEYFEIQNNQNKAFDQKPFILTLNKGVMKDHYILDNNLKAINFDPPIYDGIAKKLYLSHNSDAKILKLKGTTYTFIKVFSRNYAHWVHDILPCFRLFDYQNKKIHVPYFKSFHQEYLSLLGISPKNIIPYPNKISIQSDILKFVYSGTRHEGITEYLRNQFCCGRKKRHKIYISRQDAHNRKIINEKDLVDILKIYGFKIFTLGQMSVKNQIKIFEEAEVVVLPHGAACANLFYCQPGTQVFQFWPEATTKSIKIYPKDLIYYDLLEKKYDKNDNMFVNLERIKLLLKEFK